MANRARTQQYEVFDDEDPPIDGYQPPALSQGKHEEPQNIKDKKKEIRNVQIELLKIDRLEKGENNFLPTSNAGGNNLRTAVKNELKKKETQLKQELKDL